MVRDKLTKLKEEILHYVGLPYFCNIGKFKNNGDNAMVGKGTAKEIALKTIELANLQNSKLLDMTPEEIYNFQKKNHLGIDCSGLASNLLNFYFGTEINPRKTSAKMLTSSPLSKRISIQNATTGDLIKQKGGKHVLFIIEKVDDSIYYVDSSVSRQGVKFGQFNIKEKQLKYDGIYRLK